MNKTLKKVLIVVGSLIAAAILLHLAGTYLIPFISRMHNSGEY
jgi:hypothetical protein